MTNKEQLKEIGKAAIEGLTEGLPVFVGFAVLIVLYFIMVW